MKKIILIVSIALTTLAAHAGNIELSNGIFNRGYLLLNGYIYHGDRQEILDIAHEEGYAICGQPNDTSKMYMYDVKTGNKSIFYHHKDGSWAMFQ